MKYFLRSCLSFLVLFLIPGIVLGKCVPGPAAKVSFSPPPFRTGYFEVHNKLTGLPCDQIRCLLSVGSRVLAGTDGGGLMIYHEGSWSAYTPQSSPPFPAPTVIFLITTREQDVVLAGTVAGIVKVTLSDKPTFELIQVAGGMSPNVLSLAESETGLLVGTDRRPGKLANGVFSPFSFLEEDTAAGITCIECQGQNVWLGNSNGLFELQEPILQRVASFGVDLGWVNALLGKKNVLYIAASNGLFRIMGSLESLVPGVWSTCLSLPQGTMDPPDSVFKNGKKDSGKTQVIGLPKDIRKKLEIIGALERRVNIMAIELSRIRKATQTSPPALEFKYNCGAAQFRDMASSLRKEMMKLSLELEKGLWMGTQDKGAIFFGLDGVRRDLTTENSKLPSNRVTAITSAQSGETWIGTFDAGLLRYCLVATPRNNEPVSIWTGKANLVRACGELIYVGTKENGLLVFDPKTGSLQSEINSTVVSGFHKEVTGVAMDQQSRLWVSGTAGVWMKDEKGWHHFTTKDGLPDENITCLECDSIGRIYVAGSTGREISRHLASFNGSGFTSYSVDTLRRVLALPTASASQVLEGMGMTGTYIRSFDIKTPKKALEAYDDGGPEGEVSALFGANDYLLLGTREGNLFFFSGEQFLRVDGGEVGQLGSVAAINRRQNGDIIFVTSVRVMKMDGQHFEEVPPVLGTTVNKYTDLAIDTRNSDLFWISFDAGDKGGIALYQEPLWSELIFKFPVRSMALADPFIFMVGEEGVYRVMR